MMYSEEVVSLSKRFDLLMVDATVVAVVVNMCEHLIVAVVGISLVVDERLAECFDNQLVLANKLDCLEVWLVIVPFRRDLGTLEAMEFYCKEMNHSFVLD